MHLEKTPRMKTKLEARHPLKPRFNTRRRKISRLQMVRREPEAPLQSNPRLRIKTKRRRKHQKRSRKVERLERVKSEPEAPPPSKPRVR